MGLILLLSEDIKGVFQYTVVRGRSRPRRQRDMLEKDEKSEFTTFFNFFQLLSRLNCSGILMGTKNQSSKSITYCP